MNTIIRIPLIYLYIGTLLWPVATQAQQAVSPAVPDYGI